MTHTPSLRRLSPVEAAGSFSAFPSEAIIAEAGGLVVGAIGVAMFGRVALAHSFATEPGYPFLAARLFLAARSVAREHGCGVAAFHIDPRFPALTRLALGRRATAAVIGEQLWVLLEI